jgi:hypothetical protein
MCIKPLGSENLLLSLPVFIKVDIKDLKNSINNNRVGLFERHKPSPRPNTIMSIKVMVVTSGKHSEHETEPACFVICTLLAQFRHRKVHCTPWSS